MWVSDLRLRVVTTHRHDLSENSGNDREDSALAQTVGEFGRNWQTQKH